MRKEISLNTFLILTIFSIGVMGCNSSAAGPNIQPVRIGESAPSPTWIKSTAVLSPTTPINTPSVVRYPSPTPTQIDTTRVFKPFPKNLDFEDFYRFYLDPTIRLGDFIEASTYVRTAALFHSRINPQTKLWKNDLLEKDAYGFRKWMTDIDAKIQPIIGGPLQSHGLALLKTPINEYQLRQAAELVNDYYYAGGARQGKPKPDVNPYAPTQNGGKELDDTTMQRIMGADRLREISNFMTQSNIPEYKRMGTALQALLNNRPINGTINLRGCERLFSYNGNTLVSTQSTNLNGGQFLAKTSYQTIFDKATRQMLVVYRIEFSQLLVRYATDELFALVVYKELSQIETLAEVITTTSVLCK